MDKKKGLKVPSMISTPNTTTIVLFIIAVLIVAFIALLITYKFNEKFANTVNSVIKGSPKLEELHVIMFMDPNCKFCKEQLEVFKKEGVLDKLDIKSIDVEDNKKQAVMYGVKGFPFFISTKNKTASMGFQETTADLIKSLEIPEGKVFPQQQQQAQQQAQTQPQQGQNQNSGSDSGVEVVVLTRENCGWCKKAKADIAGKNLAGVSIKIIDINSQEGKDMLKIVGKEGSSVPLYINPKNKKEKTGFYPIEQIVEELK